MITPIGRQTLRLDAPVHVTAGAAIGGKLEGEGPLRDRFDEISEDSYFGQKSWEAAETVMLGRCFALAAKKAGLKPEAMRYVLSGDLQNQCTGSAYAARDLNAPYLGLYSACATMGEALGLGAILTAAGAGPVCAMTCSHFCSAERQFRTPLEYGSQRSPVAQWTATAAGAAVLRPEGYGPRVTHVTTGRIVDAGITDIGNMGAAMAPAALDTLAAHFRDTGREPEYYDAVITGDLAKFGHELLAEMLAEEGFEMPAVFTDCGMLIYDPAAQDVHSGGSGAGCSASVFAGHILRCLNDGIWKKVLFAPTGALMSPVTVQQGESIPAICHAVALELPGESHAERVERREEAR
ncbi:MAG: stage V sporulation protein AD [Oscillospiraceae bacterium]|nr:stage V sporulation protein AD [Oscillospiraceae bacterium]